ncbi:MAG: LacI family DNA-binding transcriptional regulator [Saprospiraceae bacterium]|nr:LacI family DNA-binding transcriptional regulator [Saprospiraceae bacterium]
MRVRIKDIAEKAGVSTGTVDRVIHNRGNVAPSVKAQVEQVMNELGYKRNLIASTLAYNRTIRLAALVFNEEDPYWSQISSGIEKAREATLHYGVWVDTFLCDQRNPQHFAKSVQQILDSRPDGVLVAPLFLKEGTQFLRTCGEKKIPVALINTQMSEAKALCYIGQDSYQSGFVAARLLNFGMKKRATVLLLNLDSQAADAQHLLDKERGFRDYFRKDHSKSVRIIAENFAAYDQPKALQSWFGKFLQNHPDLAGIFVTNSRAYLLLDALENKTLEDINVVGFDLVPPNLAHLKANRINFLINQNPVLQGYMGIINLVNHILLKQKVSEVQYLPLDIVVRENCDYYLKGNLSYPLAIY